jgi:hypothetical protein
VLGREVVEHQQRIAVFSQAIGSSLVFDLVGFDKEPAPGLNRVNSKQGLPMRRFRLFGQLPGRNKLKASSRLLVAPFPEIKFILSCCGVL